MSFEHDKLAHESAKCLLDELRQGRAAWSTARLTTSATYWQGMSDWPRPDKAFEDTNTGASFAIEFKPPGQTKREYVTGVGQTLTYLRSFEYAALVLPTRAGDGYAIADYIQGVFEQDFMRAAPVALFSYEATPTALAPRVHLRVRQTAFTTPARRGRKVFWAYWRELSPFEVLDILLEMDQRASDFNTAYRHFWDDKLSKGRALLWEGSVRRPKSTSFESERANASLSMRHIGLVESGGHMTEAAYELLRHGKVYGADSVSFKLRLGNYILGVGKHLDLIFWVEEQQRNMTPSTIRTAAGFYRALDSALQVAGIIARTPQGPKPTFLRDEQKLWNKLKLLVPARGGSYFHRGRGLLFDWRAIIAMANADGAR